MVVFRNYFLITLWGGWLFFFFAVIGASVITFAFSMMVSISPELNQFSVSILKSKNIDLILVMFPVSLILSGIVVISFIPRNKKVSKNNSPESGKRKLGSFSSQNSIQGDQAKVAAQQLDAHLEERKKIREQLQKKAQEKELEDVSDRTVLPRPD